MKIILASILLCLIFCWWLYSATTGVSIKGGQIKTMGGYMAIGPSVSTSSGAVAGTTGQCIGILCGVTYPN